MIPFDVPRAVSSDTIEDPGSASKRLRRDKFRLVSIAIILMGYHTPNGMDIFGAKPHNI